MARNPPTTGPATGRALTPAAPAPVDEVLAGLSRRPRQLSPKYFYDEMGSRLFEEICLLPEYYPTRTELSVMHTHAGDIAARFGSGAVLIEPGAGATTKARVLLGAMDKPLAYVPIDISGSMVDHAPDALAAEFPGLPVLPVCADFTQPIPLPELPVDARRIVYFPGSTIGNFPRHEASALLRTFRELMGPDGGLLIGVDLVKPREILLRAYNDASGVTARFNRNALAHVNRLFGGDFRPETFRHRAVWDEAGSRIEMRLVSTINQTVRIASRSFSLAAGEYIVTEHSHKYTVAGFAALAAQAGLALDACWTDPLEWFCVQYFRRTGDLANLGPSD